MRRLLIAVILALSFLVPALAQNESTPDASVTTTTTTETAPQPATVEQTTTSTTVEDTRTVTEQPDTNVEVTTTEVRDTEPDVPVTTESSNQGMFILGGLIILGLAVAAVAMVAKKP